MAPIEGEYRILNSGKVKIVQGSVPKRAPLGYRGRFTITENNPDFWLKNGKEEVRVCSEVAYEVGRVSVFDGGLNIDRRGASYKGFPIIVEVLDPGQELTVSRPGLYSLTVKCTLKPTQR